MLGVGYWGKAGVFPTPKTQHLTPSHMYDVRLAPEVGGGGGAGGGGDGDGGGVLEARRFSVLPEVAVGERVGLCAARRDECEAAQAGIEMLAPDAVVRLAVAVA